MSIVPSMRTELKTAMKLRDPVKTNFLRYWIAQFTLGTGEEVSDADAVKKMRGVLREARTGPTTFTPDEVALLEGWVPASLTREQIAETLAPARASIQAAPKDGIAMGLAMKALAGQAVESDDVKAVVAEFRAGG